MSAAGHLLFDISNTDVSSIFLDAISWLSADDLKLVFNSLNFEIDLSQIAPWNLQIGTILNAAKTKRKFVQLKFSRTVKMTNEIIRIVTEHKDLSRCYLRSKMEHAFAKFGINVFR